MPQYQIWLLNDDYTKSALLVNAGETRTWTRLYYRQALNAVETASIDLVPSSPKIADIDLMKRLLIVRNGEIVWGGILLREDWEINENAPDEDKYQLHALGGGVYAAWRDIVPPTGEEYDTRTGAADDLAKAYVYHHAGAGADADRQFDDLTVQADASECASITQQASRRQLLSLLQSMAAENGFRWRFTPAETGFEFQTAVTWGLDRTKDNGVNAECVWSLDRHNVSRVQYTRDLMEHYNYLYVGGQGEGADRNWVEREDAAAGAVYKRREKIVDARHLSLTAGLERYGDGKLAEYRQVEVLSAAPRLGSWKTEWDMGDWVTVYANRYGRTFSADVEIDAVQVEIFANGIEHVRPELPTGEPVS